MRPEKRIEDGFVPFFSFPNGKFVYSHGSKKERGRARNSD